MGASTYSGQSLSVAPGMPVIRCVRSLELGSTLVNEMDALAAEVFLAQTSRMLLKPENGVMGSYCQ